MAGVAETPPRRASNPADGWRVRRGAKALIAGAGSVLLVRERHADGDAFWTLPGGGVASLEPDDRGVRRELAEELRCPAVVGEPLTEFWYPHASRRGVVSVYTVFECALLSGPTPSRSEGIEACQWVSPDDPPPSTLPPVRHVLAEDCVREATGEAP